MDYRFRNLAWFIDYDDDDNVLDTCRSHAYVVHANPEYDYDFDVMWFSNAWFNLWEAPVSGRIIVNANKYLDDSGKHTNKHLPRNWFFA